MKQFLSDIPDLQLLPFYEKKLNTIGFILSFIGSFFICTIFIIFLEDNKVNGNWMGLPTVWFYVIAIMIVAGIWSMFLMRQVLTRYRTIDKERLATKRLNKQEKALYQAKLDKLKQTSNRKGE